MSCKSVGPRGGFARSRRRFRKEANGGRGKGGRDAQERKRKGR